LPDEERGEHEIGDEAARDARRAQRDELAFEIGERDHRKEAEEEPRTSASPAPNGRDVERSREAIANRRDGWRVRERDPRAVFARRDEALAARPELGRNDRFDGFFR